MVLDKIKKENDIKNIDPEKLETLAEEIREFLIKKISLTGGHLASNLGVVELTMALHLVFDLPKDKLIWDVGHQSYTHKILTGRISGFDSLRKYKGLSGYPRIKESACDAFGTGHSSTSVSAGLGYVYARDLKAEDYNVVSIIGDGAMTGGMAYEALNNAAKLKSNFIIVLNDNNMSISKNVGGMSRYLSGLRTSGRYIDLKKSVDTALLKIPKAGEKLVSVIQKTKGGIKQLLVPGMLFEDMGITYLGPVDGHDVKDLCTILNYAKRVEGAVLIHVITKKGKGYAPAEENPTAFHGTGPFVIATGEQKVKSDKDTYSDVFSKTLCDIAGRDEKVAAVTAAMPDGTGLVRFRKYYPKRFFDVGIAEQHALTFAAGLAAGGLIPVVALYSSFLQRGFDQAIHDICLQDLHVVIAVDRAGLVGSDGETHQGLFDLSYLSLIPDMTVMSPKNRWELADMLRFAVCFEHPVAIRYPKGESYMGLKEFRAPIKYGKCEVLYEEKDIAVFFVGHMAPVADKVRMRLKEAGYGCTLVNARFVKPLDEEVIIRLSENHSLFVTLEENVLTGGYGRRVLECASRNYLDVKVLNIGLPDAYVEHGNIEALRREIGIDEESVSKRVIAELSRLKGGRI